MVEPAAAPIFDLVGGGTDEDEIWGRETAGPLKTDGYVFLDGNSCGLLHQDEGQPVAGAEDARPSGFPSVEELEELNRRIHDDAGSPELVKLDQPSPLRGCQARASAAYVATPEGVIKTAALLAHGIAQAQAFVDGTDGRPSLPPSSSCTPTAMDI